LADWACANQVLDHGRRSVPRLAIAFILFLIVRQIEIGKKSGPRSGGWKRKKAAARHTALKQHEHRASCCYDESGAHCHLCKPALHRYV